MLLTFAAFLAVRLDAGLPDGSRLGIVVGIVASWLAQTPIRRRSSANPPGSVPRLATSVVGTTASFCLIAALTPTPCPASPADGPADTILAIFPYEGRPELKGEPARVILRLADYERLRALAEAPGPSIKPEIFAIEATHRVDLLDPRTARITSDLTLEADGDGPHAWHVPMAGARSIRTTLGGHPHPIRIGETGGVGVVVVEGPGPHRLRVERAVAVAEGPGGREIVAAINPVPRAEVATRLGPCTVVGALDRGPKGEGWALGPARELRVELARPDGAATPARAAIKGLILWDALPAGDRLRVRLAPAGGSVAELSMGLEPGVQVRVADRRRLIRSTWEEQGGAVAWSAAFDPPCTVADPVEVELWRPRSGGGGTRRIPRVALEGRSFAGVVAFRRPGDWSGRLDEPGGFGGRDEETFVAAWGRLPDDPLTLAGALAFRAGPEVEVETRPVPLRRTIASDARLELREGRLDLSVDATVKDVSGPSTGLDVDLPAGLILDHVAADGLMSLSRPRPDRVHLELTRVAGGTRKVVLRGQVLVAPDAPLAQARRYRVAVPWPKWSGARRSRGR